MLTCFFMRLLGLAALIAVSLLTACGTPGAPLPPSLGIPKPVSDLQAARTGSTVTLTWTNPRETTDGELIRKRGKVLIYRRLSTEASGQRVGEVALAPTLKEQQPGVKQTVTDSLSELLSGPTAAKRADFASYTIVAESSSGKNGGPSEEASVPLVPTLPQPQIALKVIPDGVVVGWQNAATPPSSGSFQTSYSYRIMRREEGAKEPVKVGQVSAVGSAIEFLDSGIEWQKSYEYWVTPVTSWELGGKSGEVEGESSAETAILANDTFPPARPSGLQAVSSGQPEQPGIDLTWSPNTDQDLAGYNVYRQAADQPPAKINNELVKTPSFHDANVQPGTTYVYSVSAVDLRGNESARSEQAQESVPKAE
jgi:hypothetical protein